MALAISWQRPWQEVPPVSSAGALRTVAPHGSIAESRKDGGAQSQGGRYGRNVCLPQVRVWCPNPLRGGVFGRYLGFGGWGPHE